ncbi:peptide chain release factor 2 [Clostridium sp. CAG:762]|nr:peptide chain release factor 2 [Clostridium sp. CAG:762]
MEIHSGAGGTEACDWVNMLYRMYTRYFNKIGYTSTLLYASLGEETGYKSITLQIKGDHAYGYLKKESGIHRLVRISPFDSSKRRHTSFASVEVIPEIEDDIDIAIPETDLKIDIYRSSGPGGQGVNTTDSAVRITHIPTGIVVTCQNERSQIQNKAMCLEILKSKLYKIEQDKKNKEINSMKNNESINFGSQKRSYIMCPYTKVIDNDSHYEESDVIGILDGKLDGFIKANLKGGV